MPRKTLRSKSFTLSRPEPKLDFSFTSHAISVPSILATTQQCFEHLPEAYLPAIRGYEGTSAGTDLPRATGHRIGLSQRRVHYGRLRPGRERGPGRGRPRRVLRPTSRPTWPAIAAVAPPARRQGGENDLRRGQKKYTTRNIPTPKADRARFCLTDEDVMIAEILGRAGGDRGKAPIGAAHRAWS